MQKRGQDRNLTVTKQCAACGKNFHPMKRREQTSLFCSFVCFGDGQRSRAKALDTPEGIKRRLLAKVKHNGDCWEWTGGKHPYGYGLIYFGGRARLTHRVSHIAYIGPVPDEMCVLHKCDNPPCVNPEHLFLGTDADNVADMDRKGRRKTVAPKGEQHPASKLTTSNVRAIRRSTERSAKLARDYSVALQTILRIRKGFGWKHVT